MFQRGDFVESDGLLAVVVATEGDEVDTVEGTDKVPEGHVAVWFGDPQAKRISEGGSGDSTPEVWTLHFPGGYIHHAARLSSLSAVA